MPRKLTREKLEKYLPLFEKILQHIKVKKPLEVEIPTARPASLYKDLWLLRTHFKLAGPDLKFYKRDSSIVVRVEPQLDMNELILNPTTLTIENELTRQEIATMLVNKRPSSVTLPFEHLEATDIEKLDKVFEQLNYKKSYLGSKILLTLTNSDELNG